MPRPDTNEGILDITPGTELRIEESSAVEDMFGFLLSQIAEERGDDSPTDHDLQKAIVHFLQKAGADVAYGTTIGTSGSGLGKSVFDIVAREDGHLRMIEVKVTVSQDDMDKMYGQLSTLRASGVDGKLYLGIDILNQFDLVSGILRQRVKELMTNEGMGVILADNLLMVVCDSFGQLTLDEMPTFLFLNE